MARPILAIDLGGTNLRLALVDKNTILERIDVSSRTGLIQPIKEFLHVTKARPLRCVIGIAGPLSPDRKSAQMTNLSLNIDATALKKELKMDVLLINDFEAMSWGVLSLKKEDMIELSSGNPDPSGTRGIIGAGTGLGEGMLIREIEDAWQVIPSEGGHALLAGTSKDARDFIDFLIKEKLTNGATHPDYESILSGRGLFAAYQFYRKRSWESPGISKEILAAQDRPAMVSRFALEGKSKAAVRAMDLFVTFYAEECMNLALKAKATGGIYIVGNIAQKNRSKFIDGRFAKAFTAMKEPSNILLELLKKIPVYLVTTPDLPLYGAATAGLMMK